MKDNDDITPAQAIRKTWGWVPFGLNATAAVLIISLAAAGGIIGIIYLLIPATTAVQVSSAKHQVAVNNAQFSATVASMSYQQPLVAQMQQHLTNITGPAGLASTRQSLPADSPEQVNIRASELNEVTSLCSESVNLDPGVAPGSIQMEQVVTANCYAGTPVSAPPLADPVPAGGQ